ncbi:MAG: electron transport complex subunit RsxG [Gammaproteobacteria bacterium]|nr:electron transport complex subunit RsxG [Gammaproteobacteria bacterium]MBU1656074.1 electron transport complex subunit RsxG [Gammaproteobacteria bacterium]MBU1960343.1 electron transport complex subunit RsxG [Gammaproteobacteria bacterium]
MVNLKPVAIAGILLALFAALGTGLVAFTHWQTRDRIAENERRALLRKLEILIPPERVDNDMIRDSIQVHRTDLLGSNDTTIYRGRLRGEPVAAVLTPMVPDGYGGPINLLVAVDRDGTLAGVRVISHKETPGLGDKVEEERSDWIYSFNGKSLGNPPEEQWKVKRDGGDFDQFTGATITPRTIVKAVRSTLIYVREQGDRLYRAPPQSAQPKEKP